MPIAHCIVGPDVELNASAAALIIERWAGYADKSGEQMTVTLTKSDAQFGVCYNVMANLYLPSMWSNDDVGILQLALAKSLADCFDCSMASVHVMSSIVPSGHVVENGEMVEW